MFGIKNGNTKLIRKLLILDYELSVMINVKICDYYQIKLPKIIIIKLNIIIILQLHFSFFIFLSLLIQVFSFISSINGFLAGLKGYCGAIRGHKIFHFSKVPFEHRRSSHRPPLNSISCRPLSLLVGRCMYQLAY